MKTETLKQEFEKRFISSNMTPDQLQGAWSVWNWITTILPKDIDSDIIKKIENIKTLDDAQNFAEGCLNDFEEGISTKEETLNLLGEYTGRIMEIFANNLNKLSVEVSIDNKKSSPTSK